MALINENAPARSAVRIYDRMLIVIFALALLLPGSLFSQQGGTPAGHYVSMQTRLAKGWNTWNTNSVLSHVHLPDGLAIDLVVQDSASGGMLKDALIGLSGADIQLLAHSFDGAYTELVLNWRGVHIRVRSATTGDDEVILVEALVGMTPGNRLYILPHMLWGKAGVIKDNVHAYIKGERTDIFTTGVNAGERVGAAAGSPGEQEGREQEVQRGIVKYLGEAVTVSTGKQRTEAEIAGILQQAKNKLEASGRGSGSSRDVYDAIRTVLAWNVIYDADNRRVINPVSRFWSQDRGGYVLFCWDNYFAAYMCSAGDRELSYANVIETTAIIDQLGFVPNHNGGNDISRDRSQPPIGSMVVKRLYDTYHDKWLPELLFDRLLRWNRWWPAHRQNGNYLSWGSTPYPGMDRSIYAADPMQKAMWESGLDNSPMYDGVPFDSLHKQTMELADVGLMSLYVLDCKELASLARILGKRREEAELTERARRYGASLQRLWNEKEGIFLNKRTDNGEWSERLSPTNFYPLLAGVATPKQAKRMIDEHFYNPKEFWGEYILPSIARNDPAYKDNNYWRGRIWAPMNFLLYLGLRNYDLPQARKDLVEKSGALLMKGWLGKRHIYENYNADSGVGDDVPNSDHFYHWGGLLGFMGLLENGNGSATVGRNGNGGASQSMKDGTSRSESGSRSGGGVIYPTEVWPDSAGNHIQAHGGGILKLGATYYWYGEERAQGLDTAFRYVSCYASTDLVHWAFRGDVVRMANPENLPGHWILERPKVFYNRKTHQYVMYFHLDDGSYKTAKVGIAVSDRPDGPFTYVRSFRPLGHESRDIGQFIDDDGTAYLVFEDRPYGFRIGRLSDDYMDVQEQMCLIPAHMEGGAIVHYKGLYYAIGSALTGWAPNPNKYATAVSLRGPWSDFKDIAPPATNTYGAQSTLLLKVQGTQGTTVLFMGDIWKPEMQWDSRYLWMPLQIGDGKLWLPAPQPFRLDARRGTFHLEADSARRPAR